MVCSPGPARVALRCAKVDRISGSENSGSAAPCGQLCGRKMKNFGIGVLNCNKPAR